MSARQADLTDTHLYIGRDQSVHSLSSFGDVNVLPQEYVGEKDNDERFPSVGDVCEQPFACQLHY